MTILHITPRDPLIVRDGRPFANGDRMHCLNWPYPSVVAGTLRSLLGKQVAPADDPYPFANDALLTALKDMEMAGPLPVVGSALYVPAPGDLLLDGQRVLPLRPALQPGEGCDLPVAGLVPVQVTEEGKPSPGPAFWRMDKMVQWQVEDCPSNWQVPLKRSAGDGFLDAFQQDERVHIRMDEGTGTAAEHMLFTSTGIVLGDGVEHAPVQLAVRAGAEDADLSQALARLDALHSLGGERRIVHVQAGGDAAIWQCPDAVRAALRGCDGVRMTLATPAVFDRGWLPGWLDEQTLIGSPPGSAVQLRLRSACVQRWKPISGWSLEKGQRGPKPVRRLVPAGSVYFFDVEGGAPEELVDCWLCSVADADQDRKDGFGLSIWGLWNKSEMRSHDHE